MPNEQRHIPKLHVLLGKDEVDNNKVDDSKIAVVFDVLLATTTITALLHHGAKEIIPVVDGTEGIRVFKDLDASMTILTGESGGITIEGFEHPLPTMLKHSVAGKSVILSTTNGTVAILKVAAAKRVYAASLLNAEAVAHKIAVEHPTNTVLIVCAGSSSGFNIEDFYGAGCLIHELNALSIAYEMTDSALAALHFYRGNANRAFELVQQGKTGKMMWEAGLTDDVSFAIEKGVCPVVPRFDAGKLLVEK